VREDHVGDFFAVEFGDLEIDCYDIGVLLEVFELYRLVLRTLPVLTNKNNRNISIILNPTKNLSCLL